MSGWICLHRDIVDHWIYKDAENLKAWIDLLMLANIENKKFMINDSMILCKRGQLAYSQLTLAERWKWSRQNVRTFLAKLSADKMISIFSTNKTTIITICNYSLYQDYSPANQPTANQQLTNSQPTANQQLTTTKQYNNKTIKQLNNKTINNISFEPENGSQEESKKKNPNFQKPTLEEIENHIIEKKLSINASTFYLHYETNGWMVGKNKMKCWKSALSGWDSRQRSSQAQEKEALPKRRVF